MKNPIDYDYRLRIIPKLLREYGFNSGAILGYILQRTGHTGFIDTSKTSVNIPDYQLEFIKGFHDALGDLETMGVITLKDAEITIHWNALPRNWDKSYFFFAPLTLAKWDGVIPSVILGNSLTNFLFLREEEDWDYGEQLPRNTLELSKSLNLLAFQVIKGIKILESLELVRPSKKYWDFDFKAIRFYIKELKKNKI